MGGTKHLVDVYLTSTAAPSGGKAKVTAGAQAGQTPPTFFLLLVSALLEAGAAWHVGVKSTW